MVYLAIIALLGGIACGMTGLDENVIVSWITSNKDMICREIPILRFIGKTIT